MKTWTISKLSVVIAVAGLPLLGGCVREQAKATPAVPPNNNQTTVVAAPAPGVADQELANAPARLVSRPQPAAQGVALDATAAELVRLTQSGVDEKVMLAYVNNSAGTFNLGSDQIIYLNDIGVPSSVVTAMIQRDQVLKTANTAVAVVQAPVPAPIPETIPAPAIAQEAPAPQANVTATYFYDSLAPYGNWIEVEGYGRCWQPAVEVVDRGWTPYCDRGHWVYSDCGWYWASDYSWGWAPFHYGRWFRHNFWGWCWAPDTVWGPSWVSWRYNSGYCGWAPLPPTACYRPGFGFSYYGRSVGVSFEFGLGADCFTFVAADRFCDARPYQHRIPHHEVTQIFNSTVIINPVAEDRGNPRFHRGIPPKHIAEVTHTELKPVKIQETPNRPEHGERHDAKQGTLTVFQPHLPLPPAFLPGHRIGEGIKPATPDTVIRRNDSESKIHRAIPGKNSTPEVVNSRTPERPVKTVPTSATPGRPPQTENPQPGRPVFGNNPHRITHEDGNTPNPTASKIEREVPLPSPGPAGLPANPKTPPPQNHFASPRPAQPTLPSVAAEQPTEPSRPARHEQPFIKPAGQPPRQPHSEMSLPAPAVPAALVQPPTPAPARNYPTPQPFAPREPREIRTPAPERTVPSRSQPEISSTPSRVVVPQTPPPRIETPQGSSRPIPAQPSPDSSRKSDGGSRDKRPDGGNSPRNR